MVYLNGAEDPIDLAYHQRFKSGSVRRLSELLQG
jgi:hypothetical protein